MKSLAALSLLFAVLPSAAAARATRRSVAVVVAGGEAAPRPLFDRVARGLGSRDAVSRFVLSPDEDADPIAKGRLLADLAERDLVVPVGDRATAFVTGELEGSSACFVGAGAVDGAALSGGAVGGVFSYSVSDLLDAVRDLGVPALGVVYTPGYEPVAGWIRTGAAARGLRVAERRVAAPRDLPAAARAVIGPGQAVWIVGDPLLIRGAGFEYLRERALSLRVPLIASDPWAVRHGALLAYEASPRSEAERAVAVAASMLSGPAAPAPLRPAPRGGVVLVNAVLARKWGLAAAGHGWRPVR
jgi:hypothetical protein